MIKLKLRRKLASNSIFLTLYASFFIFLLYTIMYAYRKPFSAGIYDGDTIWDVDAKILFILAQIFGYATSKFIGIRFLPTIKKWQRKYYIVGALSVAWISLLGFATFPPDWKLLALVVNGFPLGMIWGLVFSYIEGRRISEILNVGLSVCFIISSGIVKTLGVYIMNTFNVTEYWMPFAVGTACFPLLLISVYFLDIIPKPSSDDIKYRTKRVPMNKEEQNKFFKKFFVGLFMIILFYGVLTVFREMRDAFASNYWEEVGFFNTAIFTQTEIPIAIILTVLMGFVVFVKNNHTALNILYLIAVLGGIIMIGSTVIYIYGHLSPIMWMIIVGTGLFMGYIPFSFIVERLISSLKISSTAVFVLYMGDSVGYFGTAGVFLYKNFSNTAISWDQMLTYTALITGVFSLLTIVVTYIYFRNYFKSKQFLDTLDDKLHLDEKTKELEKQNHMVKTAVIMAAGLGTRFGTKTELIPKSFIEVHNKSMISRSIEMLIDCGIERIIIGTGYKSEMFDNLRVQYPQVETVYSEKYAETNSMWTLNVCKELIGGDDFLLLESDLIYEKRAITELLNNSHKDIMLMSDVIKFQDQYYIESNEKDELVNCSVNENDLKVSGELVGIHKISNVFFEELKYYYSKVKDNNPKMGYEFGLLYIAQNTVPMYTLKIKGLQWYEIDDDNDLEYAEKNINIK